MQRLDTKRQRNVMTFQRLRTTTRHINKQMFFTNRHRRFGLFTKSLERISVNPFKAFATNYVIIILPRFQMDIKHWFQCNLFSGELTANENHNLDCFILIFHNNNFEFASSAIVTDLLENIVSFFRLNVSSNGTNRFSLHFEKITGLFL